MSWLLLSTIGVVCSFVFTSVNQVEAVPNGTIIQDGWLVRSPMIFSRSDYIPVVVNNQIYVGGGCITPQGIDGSCGAITNIFTRYDMPSDTWTTMAPMPRNRTRYAGTAYQNQIFIIGGRDIMDVPVEPLDIYSITTNSWTTSTQIAGLLAFSDPWAFTIGTKVYVAGGYNVDYTTRATVLVMDMTWTNYTFRAGVVPDRHFAFGDIGGAVVNGKGYLYGGWNQTDFCTPRHEMEVYDPVKNAWTVLTPSTYGRGDMGIAAIGNTIVIAGGETKSQPCAVSNSGASYSIPVQYIEFYDTTTDKYTTWSNLAFDRFRFGSAAYGSVFYDIGGMGLAQNYGGTVGMAYPVLNDVYSKDTGIVIPKTTSTASNFMSSWVSIAAVFIAPLALALF